MNKNDYVLADRASINDMIVKMADFIELNAGRSGSFGIIGIIKRGDIIACRIRDILSSRKRMDIPVGRIDINLYRDDLSLIDYHPSIESTHIPFDINDKTVFLIDDVFFTGRTARSALNEIIDFGRPRKIMLCTLIDREQKELPIKPDFSAAEISIPRNNIVNVHLKEIDGNDSIVIIKEA